MEVAEGLRQPNPNSILRIRELKGYSQRGLRWSAGICRAYNAFRKTRFTKGKFRAISKNFRHLTKIS